MNKGSKPANKKGKCRSLDVPNTHALKILQDTEVATSCYEICIDYKNGCSGVVENFTANAESLNLFNSRAYDKKAVNKTIFILCLCRYLCIYVIKLGGACFAYELFLCITYLCPKMDRFGVDIFRKNSNSYKDMTSSV